MFLRMNRRGGFNPRGGFIRFQGSSSGGGGGGGAAIPPPPSIQVPTVKKGFASLSSIQNRAPVPTPSADFSFKRPKTEDEYFNDDEEEEGPLYQPAPGSPSAGGGGVEDDDDPLEAFMAGVQEEVKRQSAAPTKAKKQEVRDDIEELDNEESFYKFMAENPNFGKDEESGDEEGVEYDADGNPIAPKKSKYIDPLPPIDHSQIEYQPFERNFYEEHSDIAGLEAEKVDELRNALGIKVSGASIPKPVSSFGHLGFPESLMRAIRKSEFTQPTPIQAQGIPIAMSGRDIIGIAKTG